MELNNHNVVFNYTFGVKTIKANEGFDKWAEGIMVSLLVSTRESNNNSGLRRRPIGFAARPKDGKAPAETTFNLSKIYESIRDDLELVKENTCMLSINIGKNKHHCAPLRCEYVNKIKLDKEWQSATKVDINKQPTSIQQDEKLFRSKRWNLKNYNLNQIFLFSAIDIN
eukprot:349943_1